MADQDTNRNWYAVQAKPGYELRVTEELFQRGAEAFIPVRPSRSSGGVKSTRPLFQGYLFCNVDLNSGPRIVSLAGVIRIVGAGRTPLPIPTEEIERVRRVANSGLNPKLYPFGQPGQLVRIEEGPLRGTTGTLIHAAESGTASLVVSIEILRRALAVKIDPKWAVPT